jgi:hypothetical protein
MFLEQLESFLNQVPNIIVFLLRIVNPIPSVLVSVFEQVHHRKDLAVVRHERLCEDVISLH